MKSLGHKKYVLFSIFGFFSVLFIFSLILVLISSIILTPSNSKLNPHSSYLHQEINPHTKETSYGFVSLTQKLSNDDFISYSRPGTHVIITQFSDSEFECSGLCSCATKLRRTSALFTRNFLILLSAFSSPLAFKIAEKIFEDECLQTCGSENMFSAEVAHCSSSNQPNNEVIIEEEEKEEKDVSYECKGHCLRNRKIRSPSGIKAFDDFVKETGGCHMLEISATIKIKRKQIMRKDLDESMYPDRYGHMGWIAREKFHDQYLRKFCSDVSRRFYWYVYPKDRRRQKRVTNFCCSVGEGSKDSEEVKYGNMRCLMGHGRKGGSK